MQSTHNTVSSLPGTIPFINSHAYTSIFVLFSFFQGLIGIASATSTTYVVALAETTTQHGLMKERLSVLAKIFQENLAMVDMKSSM